MRTKIKSIKKKLTGLKIPGKYFTIFDCEENKTNPFSLINKLDMYNIYLKVYEPLLWEFPLDSVKSVLLLHNIYIYKVLNIIIFTLHWLPSCLSAGHVLFILKAVLIPSHSYILKSLLHIWCITFLRLSCSQIYVPDVLGHLSIVSIDVFCEFISTDSCCLGVCIIRKNH